MLNLHINGERVEVPPAVATVAGLLHHLQLQQKVLVVEYNEQILQQAAHAETNLADGDRLEIVHFVGGG